MALQLPEAGPASTRARLLRRWPDASEAVPPAAVQAAIDAVVTLISGAAPERIQVDLESIALDIEDLPAFDRAVCAVARTIAPGKTLTYGEIAARIGEPGAAREVGQALGRNRVPIIVPCHRVVAAGGGTGGFSARGGVDGDVFIKAIDAGTLPAVTFYKPQGNLNEHPAYADVLLGDRHILDVIDHLEKSPQWAHMLVVVTYDENGGFWDHVAPPKADRWGPGSRVPAIIASPFAKRSFVDHTLYDPTSILRFITHRFGLPSLPGLTVRDAALRANGSPPLGDLVNALDLSPR